MGWLLLWIGIGAVFRLLNLALKSPWGDEWATLVFSLGQGFDGIPLDQLIHRDILLDPIRFRAATPIQAVTQHLFAESNHPPLYFWLTHLWLQLWSEDGNLVSIATGRLLAALFGIGLIPLSFSLGWHSFKQRSVAHFAAIAMAVSPFGVYLSQEARHYTLGMIWIVLSLNCLVSIIRAQQLQKVPSWLLLGCWLLVNSFGIASHYFMLLFLWSEGLVLLYFYAEEISHRWQSLPNVSQLFPVHWRRIGLGAIATMVMILILMSQWQSTADENLTSWLQQDYGFSTELVMPIVRLALWFWGMMFILPLEVRYLWIVIPASIATVFILLWFVPKFFGALSKQWHQLETRILVGITISGMATLLGVTYLLKLDVTLAPRYQFIYFPAVMALVGLVCAQFWQPHPEQHRSTNFWQKQQKAAAIITVSLMVIGAISVNIDAAYRKPENGKAIAQLILENTENTPTILSTHYYETAVIRTQMGLAWSLRQMEPAFDPEFLILDDRNNHKKPTRVLRHVIKNLSKPTVLWMMNTHVTPPLNQCDRLSGPTEKIIGYRYKRYLCHPTRLK